MKVAQLDLVERPEEVVQTVPGPVVLLHLLHVFSVCHLAEDTLFILHYRLSVFQNWRTTMYEAHK